MVGLLKMPVVHQFYILWFMRNHAANQIWNFYIKKISMSSTIAKVYFYLYLTPLNFVRHQKSPIVFLLELCVLLYIIVPYIKKISMDLFSFYI